MPFVYILSTIYCYINVMATNSTRYKFKIAAYEYIASYLEKNANTVTPEMLTHLKRSFSDSLASELLLTFKVDWERGYVWKSDGNFSAQDKNAILQPVAYEMIKKFSHTKIDEHIEEVAKSGFKKALHPDKDMGF